MSQKSTIYLFMFIGSSVGGLIPMLWGADMLSFSGVIFTAIGGFLGIWIGYKVSR